MPVRNPRTLLISAALLLAQSTSALAAPPKGSAAKGKTAAPAPAAAAKSKLDLPALQKSLESGETAQMLAALDTITKSGDPTGAPLVEVRCWSTW